MVDVLTEIKIACPAYKVSEYASNPDNAPDWYVNIKSVEWLTPKPLQVGSKVAFTAHFVGKKLAYTYEFTELLPGKKLLMRTTEGPFPMETTYNWQALDNNTTLMSLRNRGTPTGFFRLFTPFMELMMKRATQKDLLLLKKILEG
jgi:hypothetical protein